MILYKWLCRYSTVVSTPRCQRGNGSSNLLTCSIDESVRTLLEFDFLNIKFVMVENWSKTGRMR